MVDRLLELARRRAQAAEVYLEESESRPIQFENNELKYVQTKQRRAVSLRLIADGRIGFASTTAPSKPEELVEHALESAQFGQPAKLEFPPAANLPQVAVWDPTVADFPVKLGIKIGRNAIAQVVDAFPDVLCNVEIAKCVSRWRLLNTAGLDTEHEATACDFYLTAQRIQGESMLWITEGNSSRCLIHEVGRYTERVVNAIRRSETEMEPPQGTRPILFTPKAMGLLLELVLTAVNGKLVQKGASPLVGRLGEEVLDSSITLADDGTRDFGEGSSPHDGEGTPARRTLLFDRGVLCNFLYDRQTAGLMDAETTGNAARPFASVPVPDATNLVLEPGQESQADLLGGIQSGLLVDEVIGGGQSNVLAGEFSVNVGLGYRVEGGEVQGRVKDCMVAGNVFELFNRVRGVADRQEIHGPVVTPAVCFDQVVVASD